MSKSVIAVIVVLAALVLGNMSLFVLVEGRQAIITEFGKPVGGAITKAGLHFKKPFVQDVRYVDKRILNWDGYPNQIPTKDKKYIIVDTTARWKIIDALKFIQTVKNESGAKARLDTILDAYTRDVISNQNLVEAVRNSNQILDKINEYKKKVEQEEKEGRRILEEEISGDIEKINLGREKLSATIAKKAGAELSALGIKLIDVQLRRISYESSVEEKVFERMISERQRIAEKIRSIGQGERAKIEGRLTKDLEKIRSVAYRKAQLIKGKGEAKSTAIYAKMLNQSPSFYDFLRSMDAYKKSLSSGKSRMILSTNSEFLKFLKSVN